MGDIINVRCKACKREWQCFIGNGLLHSKKENILAAFSGERRQQAENLLSTSKFPAFDFQYRLAVCCHCHNIAAVPVLQSMDSEETCVGSCPLCGKETQALCAEEESAEAWSKKTACPVCKSRALQAADGGYWD